MSALTPVLFVVGVAGLVGGAEALVRGAAGIAARSGMSSVVIGLTVVAFGTSAPELAVSIGAAFRDRADLAVGNVVGSNIANVLLVLGLSAAVGGGLVVAQRIVRIDVPLMIAVSLLLWLFASGDALNRWEGLVLFALLVGYIVWTVRSARSDGADDSPIEDEYEAAFDEDKLKSSTWLVDIGLVLLGLVFLVGGSSMLVRAATDIAEALGVSQLVIGLTVVAVGTSLPEVATSVTAALRGQRDLAVGNVVGSNLYNIMAVLGISAIVSPRSIPIAPNALQFDIPVMIVAAVACLPIFVNGYVIKRWEGILFLAFYVAYVAYLVLDSTGRNVGAHDTVLLFGFVLPLLIVTIAVIARRTIDARASLT